MSASWGLLALQFQATTYAYDAPDTTTTWFGACSFSVAFGDAYKFTGLAEARAGIGPFLEKVYNERRLHSALGYLPPAEFERSLRLVPGVPVPAQQSHATCQSGPAA